MFAAKSPVYSHISATFDGITTVRAFGLEKMFSEQFLRYFDDATACRWLAQMSTVSVSFHLELLSLVYICSVCFFLLAFPDGNEF